MLSRQILQLCITVSFWKITHAAFRGCASCNTRMNMATWINICTFVLRGNASFNENNERRWTGRDGLMAWHAWSHSGRCELKFLPNYMVPYSRRRNVTSCQTSPVPGCSFSYETCSTMAREVACLLFYTDLWTGSKMTWWLNTAFFIRTVTTVIKSITKEFLADAHIVCTLELIDRAVARLLTCRKITTLVTQAFLASYYMTFKYLSMYVRTLCQS